ncbi:LD-carboxypeptidase [Kitasatospora acidiphila]|uniref:LD-carboxypeptidase n=1 Tax=Kitasatospora acidiphila TaxID=2567942 RepID=A0A540VYV3_9ACTN|nr:S66 peptidase family protein [Kitasatospora acidiphila]TQF01949.1 LD-carboxypeptidase [Kitasatospora acidiphila]
MIAPVYPPKPKPGDSVAVVSPSRGLPGDVPLPYELGLRRLQEDFGLRTVEYPTTRTMGASAQARASDINAAFADPQIKAVIASVGGSDQITVLRHLDRDLIRANPKPFFGYSDNTNLVLFLCSLGIVSFHGGMVMTQYGRPGKLHPMTAESLRAALFTSGEFELRQPLMFGEVLGSWQDPQTFDVEPYMEPANGWNWHNANRVVEGAGWGGDLEIVSWQLMAGLAMQPVEAYSGGVLFLETGDSMPSAEQAYVIMRNMGERGLLEQFSALLMGRPKTWSRYRTLDAEQKTQFRQGQREAVLRALAEYAPRAVAVFDVDLGHTDPQLVIPCGGTIRVDGPERRVFVTY